MRIYRTRRLLPLLVLTWGYASGTSAQIDSTDSLIQRAAARFMASGPAVGLSIGVYAAGKRHEYNTGEQHKGKRDRPTADTRFSIGSITKTITGTLLAKAVLQQKVKLEEDIRRYLPGEYPNLAYAGHPITLSQLLNHRSGLPYMLPDDHRLTTGSNQAIALYELELYKHYTKDDFFKDLHQVKLDTLPGTKFRYSNAAAMLCGYILERIYGVSYEQLVKRELTDALKMEATRITLTPTDRRKMAAGYDEQGKLMPQSPDQLQAAGALKSNVRDMLTYIQWHLDETHQAAKLSHEPTWRTGNYWAGLNWQILQSTTGQRLIWQSGNVAGYTSYCVLYPDDQLGIVVLTNEEDRTASSRIEKLINQIATSLSTTAIALP